MHGARTLSRAAAKQHKTVQMKSQSRAIEKTSATCNERITSFVNSRSPVRKLRVLASS